MTSRIKTPDKDISLLREALEQARTPLRAIAMNGKKYGPLYSHAMQALHAIEAALSATAPKP